MIVVDASVAVKWLAPEPDDDQAVSLLTSTTPLLAPALAHVEVSAALSRRVRDNRFSVDDAATAYAKWKRLMERRLLMLQHTDELLDRAFRIALDARHTVQDCLYMRALRRFKPGS